MFKSNILFVLVFSLFFSSCTLISKPGCVKTRGELLKMVNKLSGIHFSAEQLNFSDADLKEKVNLDYTARIGEHYVDINGNEVSGTVLWGYRTKSVVLYCKAGQATARRLF